MKNISLILRFIFGLLLLMPVAGSFGLMPEPIADMYATPEAWSFIVALMESGYMMPMIGVNCLAVSLLLFANRSALAAVILAPFTVNVIAFHVFMDPAPISAAAIPAYVLLFLNLFFLWENRGKYKNMW